MPTNGKDPLVHVLWINAGLSCDGDSVALTAAMQPSVEDIVLGTLPGLPKVEVHWPLIAYETGPVGHKTDDFIEWFFKGERGEIDPFVLVIEGSIPNEAIKKEGYWCGFGNDPATGQPMTTSEWIDRSRAEGVLVLAAGHLRDLRRHSRDGKAIRPARWVCSTIWAGTGSQARHSNRLRARLSDPAGQLSETILYLLYQAAGQAPMIPLDEEHAAHNGCSAHRSRRMRSRRLLRSRRLRRRNTARRNASSSWDAGGRSCKCNVPKRGWMGGIGGCPNVGGICIGCTMPGFPDKFMPFMDEPPGAKLSTPHVNDLWPRRSGRCELHQRTR